MQRYRAVILIVVLGVAPTVVAFFVALSFLKKEAESSVAVAPAAAEVTPEPKPPERKAVLAAARRLPIGTLIREEDVTGIVLDAGAIRRNHIVFGPVGGEDPADGEDPVDGEDPAGGEDAGAVWADSLRGYAVRETVAAGEAIAWSSVVGPGQRGFLSAVLRPGTRAVTIQVGPSTRHAGLIDPGDRVDVILSAELDAAGRGRSVLARTIVEDVRVVAVDRRVGNGGELSPGDTAAEGGGEVKRTEIITATLEVSPAQGDRLVLGEHEGKLSLAVRSLAAAEPSSAGSAVGLRELLLSSAEAADSGAVKEAPPPPPEAAPEAAAERPLRTVRIFRGSGALEEVVFEQGGQGLERR